MTPKPEWKSMWQTLFTLLSFQILTIYGRIKDFIETIKSLIFICDEKENDEEKVNSIHVYFFCVLFINFIEYN
jgi:hypothetical protein